MTTIHYAKTTNARRTGRYECLNEQVEAAREWLAAKGYRVVREELS